MGIIGQDPSVSKSIRLRIVIFRAFLYLFEIYSTDASKKTGCYPEVLNFNTFISQTQLVHVKLVDGSHRFIEFKVVAMMRSRDILLSSYTRDSKDVG